MAPPQKDTPSRQKTAQKTAEESQSLAQKIEMNQSKLLESFLDMVKTDVDSLKESVGKLMTDNIRLTEQVNSLEKRLQITEGLLVQARKKMTQQEEKIIDLQARSMRDNMIFRGIDESENESWQDTETNLRNFLKNELKLPNADNIAIDRAHRMGSKLPDKPRNIVAKFANSAAKGQIFANVKNLREKKQFSIQEQFPPEINERRKQLWSTYKAAKAIPGNTVKWSMDKLIVNGQVKTAKDEQHELSPPTTCKDVEITHAPSQLLDGSTYAGHAAKLSHNVSVPDVIANLLRDRVIANADHNIYAYRFGRSQNIKEGCNDDGEHGAGARLLKMLRDTSADNVIVITTRWFGGKHSGPKRFQIIEDCATKALDMLFNEQ